MKILYELAKDLGIEIRWQYFATSHSKGVVDGIGGSAKCMVRNKTQSKQGNCIVQSAKDFYDVSSSSMKNVKHLYISQDDINNFTNDLFWEDTKETFGIKKVHTAVCKEKTLFLFQNNNEFKNKKILLQIKMEENENLSQNSSPSTSLFRKRQMGGCRI